jgi:signal transduction histidine kinase
MEPVETGSLERQDLPDEGERYQELLALSRVSAAISGLWDLDAVLKVALDNVLKIMKGTIGGILLLDEPTQTLSYHIHQGLSAGYIENMRLGPGEGIAGRVAQSGKAILLEDISTDSRVGHPDLVRAEGLKAFICVPIRAKDEVLGVINVASRKAHRFSTKDLHLLYSIGDQLGVAIQQAKLYERLRKARERYRKLTRQILVAQEDERKRLARELHDETSQTLSGLTLQLQALADMADKSGGDIELVTRLKKVQSLAVHVHTEIRRLMTDLRPSLLDTLGLVPAIRQLADTRLRPLNINVSVKTIGRERRLDSEVETGLFRVAQGSIGNIIEHSKAKNTTISVEYRDNELVLRITDDGQGFDVSDITDVEESGRGRGLFSMRERIMLLGGTASVESKVGQGTTVWASVPIGNSEEHEHE